MVRDNGRNFEIYGDEENEESPRILGMGKYRQYQGDDSETYGRRGAKSNLNHNSTRARLTHRKDRLRSEGLRKILDKFL